MEFELLLKACPRVANECVMMAPKPCLQPGKVKGEAPLAPQTGALGHRQASVFPTGIFQHLITLSWR